MPESIELAQLAEVLVMGKHIPPSWTRSVLRSIDGRVLVDEVDRFLASIACNFTKPPTWQRLVRGELVLIDSTEAAFELGITRKQFMNIMERLALPYVRLPNGQCRFTRESILHFRATAKPCVDLRFAAHAMGYRKIDEVRTAPGIEAATTRFLTKPGGGAYITEESFRRYLHEHLPQWIDVNDWIEDCTAVTDPLVALRETCLLLRLPRQRIVRELAARRASYISRRSQYGERTLMVSPLWLWSQLDDDAPLNDRQVARLFGTTSQAVNVWVHSGRRICPLTFHAHDEAKAVLWRSCWTAFLHENCSPALRRHLPLLIIRRLRAEKRPDQMLSTGDITRLYGYSRGDVESWLKSGRLLFIRTPGGEYRVASRWLQRAGIFPNK